MTILRKILLLKLYPFLRFTSGIATLAVHPTRRTHLCCTHNAQCERLRVIYLILLIAFVKKSAIYL